MTFTIIKKRPDQIPAVLLLQVHNISFVYRQFPRRQPYSPAHSLITSLSPVLPESASAFLTKASVSLTYFSSDDNSARSPVVCGCTRVGPKDTISASGSPRDQQPHSSPAWIPSTRGSSPSVSR